MNQPVHVCSHPQHPIWVAKGTIVLHTCPQTQQQTLFVLHKLQKLRGTNTLYLLPNEGNDTRYRLEECQAASWADFSTLKTLQVNSENETWLITHPHRQLTESAHTEGEAYWLSVCAVYTAALALAKAFDGTVLLPPNESLAGATESLSVQWAETET